MTIIDPLTSKERRLELTRSDYSTSEEDNLTRRCAPSLAYAPTQTVIASQGGERARGECGGVKKLWQDRMRKIGQNRKLKQRESLDKKEVHTIIHWKGQVSEERPRQLSSEVKHIAMKSPKGALILFVWRTYGTKQMCVDYRDLKNITKESCYPLPRFDKLLDRLKNAKVISKTDLKSGCFQVPIQS